MKKALLFIPVILFVTGFIFLGCQSDNNIINPDSVDKGKPPVSSNLEYEIILVDAGVSNGDGTYTWTWKVTNTNPGNGTNGTFQDLSHWSFDPGTCLEDADIESAAYGNDPDDLELISPTPTISVDGSITECTTTPLFKFNFGTTSDTPMYYQLKINKDYAVDHNAKLYWKAGNVCDDQTFSGIGCLRNPGCSSETAFGGNTGVNVNAPGNWFYYYINNSDVQNIYAGQNDVIGTVQYIGGKIEIVLDSNASLQAGSETVKIKGYSEIPTERPKGNEYDYKGISLSVPIASANYFIIHLDAEVCE